MQRTMHFDSVEYCAAEKRKVLLHIVASYFYFQAIIIGTGASMYCIDYSYSIVIDFALLETHSSHNLSLQKIFCLSPVPI